MTRLRGSTSGAQSVQGHPRVISTASGLLRGTLRLPQGLSPSAILCYPRKDYQAEQAPGRRVAESRTGALTTQRFALREP